MGYNLYNKHIYTDEDIENEIGILDNNMINLCSEPKFNLHCTARGIYGKIYAMRVFERNKKMMEYLIFNDETSKFEWINNNGYCVFDRI